MVVVPIDTRIDRVSCSPGYWTYNCSFITNYDVKKSRLADVWAPYDGYSYFIIVLLGIFRHIELVEKRIQQITCTGIVIGADRYWIAEA